ncbi:MAG: endolytic transglycosylase MltG [Chitinophagaceae bacterium]
MKKRKRILRWALVIVLVVAGFIAWQFFGPAVKVSDPGSQYLYISTGASAGDVSRELKDKKFLGQTLWFDQAARLLGYRTIRPGRYKMESGMSVVNLVRMLKNGSQSPVNFVITKIRTREDLAGRIGRSFECDSQQVIRFLTSPDSLKKYDLDTNTVMAAAMPYTYTIRWNTTPGKIFQQFYTSYKTFWTDERKQKAARLGLSPAEVSTLASIIDEETNAASDRPNIASVYLNRIATGMPLQADPTVKFALKNFGLRRVLNVHLQTPSPYNTYQNKGLPPGPICTPQTVTIDAVLDAPKTEYLYFVASTAFDGTHIFTTNYEDHVRYARLYQQELNKRNVK